jgi:hypothetical protein
MTYDFAKGAPIDLDKLRDHLRKMPNDEQRKFGKAAALMCTPEANLGKAPHQDLLLNLKRREKNGSEE